MSIRSRIVWLFVCLAVVPLLTLASFSYVYSIRSAEDLARTQMEARASRVVAALQRERAHFLTSLSRSAVALAGAEDPAVSQWHAHPGSLELLFTTVRDSAGRVRAVAGADPDLVAPCDPATGRRVVRDSLRLVSGVTVEGGYRVGAGLAELSPRHSVVVSDNAGRVLYGQPCEAQAATTLASAGTDEEAAEKAGLFAVPASRTLAVAHPVPEADWTVTVAGSNQLAASLGRLHRYYWLFVLGLAGATVLAFSLLLGRVTRSLRDLTEAAERISSGDLDPWLPPPSKDEVGRLTIAFSRMLGHFRSMVGQVDRSGRLAVVGQFSSYLAHEIRNPLSSIRMNLQRLSLWERSGDLPERCRVPIAISLEEVDRLSKSVSDVLQLGRPQSDDPSVVSLHDLVTDAAALLRPRFEEQGVELRMRLDASADRITARPAQLKGVILNLMINALEAQPDGGALDVTSKLVPGDSELPSPCLALRFSDAGPGVAREIRERIFDPFFTTKDGGSGIGLAIASQAARDNDGRLYLDESPSVDGGADFVMVFPLTPVVDEKPPALPERRPAPWLQRASWTSAYTRRRARELFNRDHREAASSEGAP